VVFENVFNIQCPLNTASSGPAIEASSGIGGILDHLLFHTIPGTTLTVMYYCLAVLLIVALIAAHHVSPKARNVLFSEGGLFALHK
jgi:hypothetical protein